MRPVLLPVETLCSRRSRWPTCSRRWSERPLALAFVFLITLASLNVPWRMKCSMTSIDSEKCDGTTNLDHGAMHSSDSFFPHTFKVTAPRPAQSTSGVWASEPFLAGIFPSGPATSERDPHGEDDPQALPTVMVGSSEQNWKRHLPRRAKLPANHHLSSTQRSQRPSVIPAMASSRAFPADSSSSLKSIDSEKCDGKTNLDHGAMHSSDSFFPHTFKVTAPRPAQSTSGVWASEPFLAGIFPSGPATSERDPHGEDDPQALPTVMVGSSEQNWKRHLPRRAKLPANHHLSSTQRSQRPSVIPAMASSRAFPADSASERWHWQWRWSRCACRWR